MKRTIFFFSALLAAAVVLSGCTSWDDPSGDEPSGGGQRTWRVSIKAGPGGTRVTRAISIGTDKKLYTSWTEGDAVEAVVGTAVVGTLTAHIPDSDPAYARLRGDITGTFSVGDNVTLWHSSSTVDYSAQTGALADVSSRFTWLTATSSVEAVDDVAGTLQMSDVTFAHQQAFLALTFTDRAGTPLDISSLSLWAESSKLVKSIATDGTTEYFSSADRLVVTPGTPTSQFFLSLRDEEGASDLFRFVASVGANTYVCRVRSPLLYGHYYVGTLKLTDGTVGRDTYTGGTWDTDLTGNVGRDDYDGGSWDDVGTGTLGRDNYIGGSWDNGLSGRTGRTDYDGDSWDNGLSGRTGRNDYSGGSWDRTGTGNTGRSDYNNGGSAW